MGDSHDYKLLNADVSNTLVLIYYVINMRIIMRHASRLKLMKRQAELNSNTKISRNPLVSKYYKL